MALEPCPECGHAISTQARTCPSCGAPVNRNSFAEGCGCAVLLVCFGFFILLCMAG